MKTIGVILAGGASRRMGQDKALLTIEELTMLARTRKILECTNVDKVVTSRNDKQAGHISDLHPHKGPLSGIHSAAMRFPHANLLIVPVDLPLIDASTLNTLIDTARHSGKNACFSEHSLPLFLYNTESLRQALDYTLCCTDHYSVKEFCSNFPLIESTLSQQSSLFNTNTPAQWRFAMQHFNQFSSHRIAEVANGSCK